MPVPLFKTTVWSGAVLVMFKVPLPVIGLPDTLIPVPAVAATLVTVPTEAEPPNAVDTPLIVMAEFTRAELGIEVRLAPEPLNVVALNIPVFGTKDNFVELVVSGRFPVVFDTIVGYHVATELVLSVIATLFALVAVTALVAVEALPDKVPTNVVEVTLTNPAIVVVVLPSDIEVLPSVKLALVRAELGILVSPAPEPLNTVEVNVPVDGTYCNFVDEVSTVLVEPLVAL